MLYEVAIECFWFGVRVDASKRDAQLPSMANVQNPLIELPRKWEERNCLEATQIYARTATQTHASENIFSFQQIKSTKNNYYFFLSFCCHNNLILRLTRKKPSHIQTNGI